MSKKPTTIWQTLAYWLLAAFIVSGVFAWGVLLYLGIFTILAFAITAGVIAWLMTGSWVAMIVVTIVTLWFAAAFFDVFNAINYWCTEHSRQSFQRQINELAMKRGFDHPPHSDCPCWSCQSNKKWSDEPIQWPDDFMGRWCAKLGNLIAKFCANCINICLGLFQQPTNFTFPRHINKG